MGETIDWGTVEGADEAAAVDRILGASFTTTAKRDAIARWLERIPPEDLRRTRRAGEVVGALIQVPMGQWFGGRSVSTMGVAGVGVDPVERGTGLATAMMREALAEWRASGFALSTLYPSTYRLYGGVGYERAGGRYLATVNLAELDVRERELRPQALGENGAEVRAGLYERWARVNSGNLDRGPYVWSRIDQSYEGKTDGCLLVDSAGDPEGYINYVRVADDDAAFRIVALDVAVATPRAARAFLSFLGGFRTMADRARWASAPNDPILANLPERRYELRQGDQWMLRVLDVPQALAARGYPRGIEAELHLSIRDEILPANDGRFVLRVSGGVGAAEPGGDGRLALDVRGLAALYTGHLSPDQLVLTGLLEGPEPEREAAAAVFAGPAPWMRDMF